MLINIFAVFAKTHKLDKYDLNILLGIDEMDSIAHTNVYLGS